MSKISSKIEGDYELVTEKVTLDTCAPLLINFWMPTTMMGRCLQIRWKFDLLLFFTVSSASEVDSGKITGRVVACRYDSKRQHGHLLAQVSLAT